MPFVAVASAGCVNVGLMRYKVSVVPFESLDALISLLRKSLVGLIYFHRNERMVLLPTSP